MRTVPLEYDCELLLELLSGGVANSSYKIVTYVTVGMWSIA